MLRLQRSRDRDGPGRTGSVLDRLDGPAQTGTDRYGPAANRAGGGSSASLPHPRRAAPFTASLADVAVQSEVRRRNAPPNESGRASGGIGTAGSRHPERPETLRRTKNTLFPAILIRLNAESRKRARGTGPERPQRELRRRNTSTPAPHPAPCPDGRSIGPTAAQIANCTAGFFGKLYYLCGAYTIILKQMRFFRFLLLSVACFAALAFTSCATQRAAKKTWYLQDATPYTPEQTALKGQIRIQPLDRLTVVVNSKDPELAAPFNTASGYNALSTTGTSSSSDASSLQVRTVDEHGMFDMPIIGKIDCRGMTRSELAKAIADRIVEGGYLNDPTVNVEFADMKFSVIGEVAHPGEYEIKNDRVSIFDALAMAGDLTVYGMRDEVAVIRETNGVRTIEYLDLRSKDIFDSPAFYLQQNDVVYVKPNKKKARSGQISQDRSFYISLVSTAISIATLVVTLSRK